MTTSPHASNVDTAGPPRPPMDPAQGVRRIPLAPHDLRANMTGREDVFVLAHLGIPRVDPAQWRLSIDGLIGRSVALGLDDLMARPKKAVDAVHQCSGSPIGPPAPTRRVTNVRWGGVDLAALLDEHGIDPRARFLWAYGLDSGEFAGRRCDWYVKDMPLTRLAAGGVLLAYELNDAPLSAEHGFPLRLVVPGYYGTNSVKWLWRLHLAARRADGPFTTDFYNDEADARDVAAGCPARRAVWAIAPESLIVTPAPGTAAILGEATEIQGWAWSFRGIASVHVSVDAGRSFARADLEARHDWAWQRYSLLWRPAASGEARICVRAFEAGGVSQPTEGARNAVHTVTVVVRPPATEAVARLSPER